MPGDIIPPPDRRQHDGTGAAWFSESVPTLTIWRPGQSGLAENAAEAGCDGSVDHISSDGALRKRAGKQSFLRSSSNHTPS
jgi:hypothetical protein